MSWPGRRPVRAAAALVLTGCGWFAAAPSSEELVERTLTPTVERTRGRSPYATPLTEAEASTRATLEAVVRRHGTDPRDPWALGHALLALGAELELESGRPAVEALVSQYAERAVPTVPTTAAFAFPTALGDLRVEPHAALLLKAFTEVGARPDDVVTTDEGQTTLAALHRGVQLRVGSDGGPVAGVASWNDSPWALQGLAAWTPKGATWTTAEGLHADLDAWTHATVVHLESETAFLAEARDAGTDFQKRGQGIFAYTCGGAHLLQGALFAVGKGHGTPADREAMEAQVALAAWRFPRELAQVDAALEAAPKYRTILLTQRLKFVGHHLETVHKAAILGLVPHDGGPIRESAASARAELVQTVTWLQEEGIYDRMPALKGAAEQVYLDLIGDSAHALRGLDLASGEAEWVH